MHLSAAAAAAPPARSQQPVKRSGLDPNDARRKREATTISIRKDKKEDSLQKRRRDISVGGTSASGGIGGGSSGGGATSYGSLGRRAPDDKPHVGALPDPALKLKLDSLPEDMTLLHSSNPEEQLEATTRFRKLLSIERNPPIAEVIAAGAVPRLVQYCQCYDNPALLLEAAWTLTNISSGTSEHTRVVIDNGAVPVFVGLVRCPHAEVREQAVWALGNIAGDSTRCRDLVLSYDMPLGLLSNLLGAMGDLRSGSGGGGGGGAGGAPSDGGAGSGSGDESGNMSMLRNATWTISNLCRGKPPPRWPLIAPLLGPLVQLLHHTDEEVLVDAAWALSYVCEPSDRIHHLLEAPGALPRLVELLGHPSAAVQTPALRCIGNVAAGSAEQTQMVIASAALPAIGALLASAKKDLKKEATWLVSNLTAGSEAQIAAVCSSGLVPALVAVVAAEEFDIRKEAAYALCNAVLGGSMATISGLVALGVLPSLCECLASPDVDLIHAVLDALAAALEAGELGRQAAPPGAPNACVHIIDECGGVEKLEELQAHENAAVYDKAGRLLDAYFADQADAVEDAQIAPQATADGFVFGAPPPPGGLSLS